MRVSKRKGNEAGAGVRVHASEPSIGVYAAGEQKSENKSQLQLTHSFLPFSTPMHMCAALDI
jgi:hypothetical protein